MWRSKCDRAPPVANTPGDDHEAALPLAVFVQSVGDSAEAAFDLALPRLGYLEDGGTHRDGHHRTGGASGKHVAGVDVSFVRIRRLGPGRHSTAHHIGPDKGR